MKWSYSTIMSLRQCNRKFFLGSILANQGRKNQLRRKIYELKKMQNLLMWRGSIVDKTIERFIIPAIINKEYLNFDEIIEKAIELARSQFKFSKNKKYQDANVTKSNSGDEYCILDIHEINQPFQKTEIEESIEVIRKSILNFREIRMPDNNILLLDFLKEFHLLLPNVSNWATTIENTSVSPQIDLIAINWNNRVVFDWKVSASLSSDYSRQLIISGIVVYQKWVEKAKEKNKPIPEIEQIKLYEVNLFKKIIAEHRFTQEKINDMIDYIYLTSDDIKLLVDGNSYKNIDIAEYDLTENESICKFCNFRKICIYLLINNNIYNEETYIKFIQDN